VPKRNSPTSFDYFIGAHKEWFGEHKAKRQEVFRLTISSNFIGC